MDAELTLNGFIDGVDGYCKQAGLSDRDVAMAWTAIVGAADLMSKQAAGAPTPEWGRMLRETAYQMPTEAVTGAVGTAASLPLTALFGQRDEWGRKRYLRNAILAAIAGAAAPKAMPAMQDALTKFEGDKAEWLKTNPAAAPA